MRNVRMTISLHTQNQGVNTLIILLDTNRISHRDKPVFAIITEIIYDDTMAKSSNYIPFLF